MAERTAVVGIGQTHHKAKRIDVSLRGQFRVTVLAAEEEEYTLRFGVESPRTSIRLEGQIQDRLSLQLQ